MTVAAVMRRYPATLLSAAIVTVAFALQWVLPLVDLWERDGAAIADGQWWRILTSFLVQGSGWGQYAFNTLGLLIIGGAVERTRGTAWWLGTAVAAQVVTSLIVLAWHPDDRDSGSSLVVSGLIGALAVTRFVEPTGWAAAAAGYRVFFAVYLFGLAVGGPVVGAIAGSIATGVAVSLVVRSRFAPWALTAVLAAVVISALGLTVAQDAHGVAILVGLVATLLAGLFARRDRASRPRQRS